jgi:hypothetical protein
MPRIKSVKPIKQSKQVVKSTIKTEDLGLPLIPKELAKNLTKYRRITKRLLMNDYFNALTPLNRRLERTKYFEEMLNDSDYSTYSSKPTDAIKNMDLRNLDYLLCLHAPKKPRPPRPPEGYYKNKSQISKPSYQTQTSIDGNTVTNTTFSTANLSDLFNTSNPFDIFSKFPQFNQQGQGQGQLQNGQVSKMGEPIVETNVVSTKDANGNVTTVTNTTRTANYNISLLPFVPIKLKTKPGEKPRYYAHKLVDENPDEINIYYYYIRDYKYLICEKSKFPFYEMTREEKETLYNTIIDSASLGIDQMIANDTYEYTEDDDIMIEELKVGELIQFSSYY